MYFFIIFLCARGFSSYFIFLGSLVLSEEVAKRRGKLTYTDYISSPWIFNNFCTNNNLLFNIFKPLSAALNKY